MFNLKYLVNKFVQYINLFYLSSMENATTIKNQTNEKTFNKKVKSKTVELMPTAKKFKKLHVPGIGYVFYIKDEDNNTIGKVYKVIKKGMLIVKN